MIPDDLFYTQDHEWLRIEGDEAVVGITDHAQEALGDITYVELPAVGKTVKPRDTLAVIESVKAASDVYAPAAGSVVATNDALTQTPELLNQSPYGEGWICRLKLAEAGVHAGLLSAADYQAFLAKE